MITFGWGVFYCVVGSYDYLQRWLYQRANVVGTVLDEYI